jgi:hypothetical protein
VKADQEQE